MIFLLNLNRIIYGSSNIKGWPWNCIEYEYTNLYQISHEKSKKIVHDCKNSGIIYVITNYI